MENSVLVQFKDLGVILVLALSAIGSVLGAGIAGMSAIGDGRRIIRRIRPPLLCWCPSPPLP